MIIPWSNMPRMAALANEAYRFAPDPRDVLAAAAANPQPDSNLIAVERAIAAKTYNQHYLNSDQVRLCCIQRKIKGYMNMDTEQQREALKADDLEHQTPSLGWKPLTVASGELSRSPAKRRAKKAKPV